MDNLKYAYVVLIIGIAAGYNACTNANKIKEEIKAKNAKVFYEVVCKHPMGYTLRYTVDMKNWDNLYHSRNSIWRFKDITGTKMRLSGPCYTDSSMTSQIKER